MLSVIVTAKAQTLDSESEPDAEKEDPTEPMERQPRRNHIMMIKHRQHLSSCTSQKNMM